MTEKNNFKCSAGRHITFASDLLLRSVQVRMSSEADLFWFGMTLTFNYVAIDTIIVLIRSIELPSTTPRHPVRESKRERERTRHGKHKQPLQTQYSLHGQALEAVDNAKYLGLSISKDLNWNAHISSITAKANRTLGFVKRNVKTRNEETKELAYKTMVRPQVEYASSVWTPPGLL